MANATLLEDFQKGPEHFLKKYALVNPGNVNFDVAPAGGVEVERRCAGGERHPDEEHGANDLPRDNRLERVRLSHCGVRGARPSRARLPAS